MKGGRRRRRRRTEAPVPNTSPLPQPSPPPPVALRQLHVPFTHVKVPEHRLSRVNVYHGRNSCELISITVNGNDVRTRQEYLVEEVYIACA